MAYQKQGFADGDILFAHHLEHIEQGIIDHEKNTENPHDVTAQQVGARPDGWVPTAEEVGAATSQDVNDAKTAAVATAQAYTNTQVRKAAHRDLLDNSDFRNPVNQRGQTSYTATGYTIDRWRTYSEDETVEIQNGYISKTGNLLQYVSGLYPDKTYTAVVCLADGTIAIEASVLSASIGGWGSMFYVAYDSSDGLSAFRLTSNAVDVKWVALYEGEYTIDTLPEYQPKGYGVELLECQRYYQIRSANNISAVDMRPLMRLTNPTITAVSDGYSYSADL